MSGGLVRGGGGQIPLSQVLLQHPHLAVAMRRDTEPIARKYEAAHPGVVVVCDWEIIPDEDIAVMKEPAKVQALADRAALAARRESAAKYVAPPVADRAGDPARTAEILRRKRDDMRLLDVTHPEYIRLFFDLARQINGLESALIAAGVKEQITDFKPAMKFPKAETMAPARKKEIEGKIEAYRQLSVTNRRLSIDAGVDHEFMRALLEIETEEPIREAIVMRLFMMGAVATV